MDICSAILAINPSAEVTVKNESLDEITFHDGTAVISKADIEAMMDEMKGEYDVCRKRKDEYDQLNQFELISDDSINGTTTHKDAILAIKAKHKKPE